MKRIVWLWLLCGYGVFGQNEKIKVTDLTKIKNVVGLETNSDGSKSIFVLKTIEPVPDKVFEYDYTSQVYLIENQKNIRQLTRAKESSSQVNLSPNGNQIAFVRNVNDKAQVFLMNLNGGEAWQLTHNKYGVANPQISHDGTFLIYSSGIGVNEFYADSVLNPNKSLPEWSLEKPGMDNTFLNTPAKANPDGNIDEVKAFLNQDVKDKKAKVINRLNFQGEANVEPEIKQNYVFKIELKENAKESLISKAFNSIANPVLSDDDKYIYALGNKNKRMNPDRQTENNIVKINIQDQSETLILDKAGLNFSNLLVCGQKLVFNSSQANQMSFGQLSISNLDGTDYKSISFDRNASNFDWNKKQNMLYFTEASNGGFPLYKMDMNTLKVERLSDFDSGISLFKTFEPNKILYVKNDISNPGEIYLAENNFKSAIQISDFHTSWLKSKMISVAQKGVYKNKIGQEVEYWIMKPVGFNSNKKYPLMLQMHGGPTAMWGPGEASMWHELQFFCSKGYGIVYANPRGSGGYGKAFQFSNYRDWGAGPQEDVLAACDAAQKESWVDTSKMVITGGSYAGYLTAWIISKDHRFKAAFAQRGVYDLKTFMGEGNAWRLTPYYFGWPWEAESLTKLSENSPYSFVDKIKTPLMIKHGENDLRTGVVQSEMMYKSMKILGKEVEYVRIPGATHELSRSGNVRQRIDRILRIYEYFNRYIKI